MRPLLTSYRPPAGLETCGKRAARYRLELAREPALRLLDRQDACALVTPIMKQVGALAAAACNTYTPERDTYIPSTEYQDRLHVHVQ
jgi:hypothetical protein